MNVVVLVKQVPDTEASIQIAEDGKSINTDSIKWVMNPYDELAVEEALQIKETHGGSVTVLSMGLKDSEKTLRTALAMGADKALLINDPLALASDSLATAKILSTALKDIPFDLILAGQRGVDEDNYQVGAAVAEFLGIPQISLVVKEEISDGKIRCHRTVEGAIEIIEASLPALITTQRGLNEPRYATLPGIMKAKKKPLETRSLADIGVDTSSVGMDNRRIKIVSLTLPPQREAAVMIQGETPAELGAGLVKMLHEEIKIV